jgi:antitoxin (DNA-binding transcriptional repressor) of toxin-antitoxin stability system
MLAVNMREARTSLPGLIAVLKDGREKEIIIVARDGRPVACLLPVAFAPKRASASPRENSRFPMTSTRRTRISRRFYGKDRGCACFWIPMSRQN